ncbi:ATP-grasp fold amidoligase family protein [Clostridium cadaveris]|uniref:ATP-grasp fold amidoligase family protein n=1 Tax=Clostridium cadaveris TaxID=1529 RepID=UPI00040FA18B|nr:ATP-grasp fold amidoligase family protein [Clostridium cadaveris]
MIKKIVKGLKKPKLVILYILQSKIFRVVPDNVYLKIKYELIMNKKLNLNNPQTFNEKLQWLKLYDRDPIYTKLVDKYEVRNYVSETIGEEYLIPLIGVWNKFEDIDFDKLPNQFVLKCTHDSGSVFICTDKNNFDIDKVRSKIDKALKKNFYYIAREWPYKNVKPRIVCEKFISDKDTTPDDYKILCFNGKAKLIEVHIDRFNNHTQDFYDINWNKTCISQDGIVSDKIYEKPKQLETMIELSEKIAKDMIHVRVDWFIVNDKLYFGEITFYDGAGFDPFDNEEDDYLIGSWIKLPYTK